MTARLEEEEFFADNGRYARTIQCLPSFNAYSHSNCLAGCGAGCGATTISQYTYTYIVSSASTSYYLITASSKVYKWATSDVLTISSNTGYPVVQNTNALKFSVFQWLFNP
jgi:type IV pilus assembly protein PilE